MTPPILILKAGTASAKDIALARAAGVLVLVVKDATDVRYMDPPLMATTRLQQVALQFVRDIGSGKEQYPNPGAFIFDSRLCFKSEYMTENKCDAYCASGEYAGAGTVTDG